MIAYLIGISHDFGKSTTFFQKLLDDGERTKYANHGFLSALFGYFVIKNYLKNTNSLEDFWYIPVIAWVVINKHHGDIKNLGETDGEISKLEDDGEIQDCLKQVEDIRNHNLKEVETIYGELAKESKIQQFFTIFNNKDDAKKFAKEIRKDCLKISMDENLKYYFDILFFYSVLLDSDKLDASETSIPDRIDIPKGLIENYKKIKFIENLNEINRVREEAYREVNDSIHSLDLRNERILSIRHRLSPPFLPESIPVHMRV